MNRRRVLVGVLSAVATAGCTARSPGASDSSASGTPSPPVTGTRTPTTGASETPPQPYPFVTVDNNHERTHRIRTDGWLTEDGRYEVEANTDGGRRTSLEVETDESRACDYTVWVEITDEGRLVCTPSAGMGEWMLIHLYPGS